MSSAADRPVTGKVAVIGLDCAEPHLVFERWREELPNLSRLMDSGTWGPLRSVDPPLAELEGKRVIGRDHAFAAGGGKDRRLQPLSQLLNGSTMLASTGPEQEHRLFACGDLLTGLRNFLR